LAGNRVPGSSVGNYPDAIWISRRICSRIRNSTRLASASPANRSAGYRSSQNYVGETVAWRKERIHFACPKPEDLAELMDGLTAAHERMNTGDVSGVIHAAAIAYGFVFLHPFEDGNGRIHRFLIHNILARRGFTPEGVMFTISASMLKNPADYEASLEAFSRQLMPLVEYSLDKDGHMTVKNDTAI
jgi:Fic family protein